MVAPMGNAPIRSFPQSLPSPVIRPVNRSKAFYALVTRDPLLRYRVGC
jgi:hypothetical protein